MQKKSKTLIKTLLGISLLTVACSNPENTTREYMPNMVDSIAVKAQEAPMRVPPEGTVPQGFNPYRFNVDQGDMAGESLKNPVAFNSTSLEKGKKAYNTYCIVCHGPTGKGNGLIVPKFPMPPSLHSDKVRNWSDARLYHVITRGQNLMPSYASQISQADRWAIINYVRVLQRAVNPTDDDVTALTQALKEGTYP